MDNTGHRERLKQRFSERGLVSFGDERVLEMLLFYAIPRKDTYPLAKELVAHFGSLTGVLEAPPEALMTVPGVGEQTATFIHYIMSLYRHYFMRRNNGRQKMDSVEKCAEYLLPRFLGVQQEQVCVLCLDARCYPISCKVLGEGSVNSANVPVRRIVEFALSCKAASVILSHNHPGGSALLSPQDITATKEVAAALEGVGILLADHLVLAEGDYTSMVESGLLRGESSRDVQEEKVGNFIIRRL